MTGGRLTALQRRVLAVLARLEPPLTLSGGAALAAVHTGHRTTRDLDLFLQRERELGELPRNAQRLLEASGFSVTRLERSEGFCRLAVSDGAESVRVDLVADPVALAEAPIIVTLEGTRIQVDTAHQILVNKLCALLSRSEPRDLWDIQVLLEAGGDLRRALADASDQDSGFSPLTVSWSLEQLPLQRLALALGWPEDLIVRLDSFRHEIVQRILAAALPAP